MAENKNLTIEGVKVDIEKAIENIAAFVKAGNTESAIAEEKKLKDLEKSYIDLRMTKVFEELCTKDKPIIEALKMHSFKVPSHKVKSNDKGIIESIETFEKDRQLDLLKFCAHAKLSTSWQYDASKFNKLLCLRAAVELGYDKDDIKKLSEKYSLQSKAKEIEMGKTPTSNTQICKLLQKVIDQIVFVPKIVDGEPIEENVYRCNNHDVQYLLALYTKKGKEKLSVAVSKDDFLRRIIATVLHRVVTNGRYSVEGFKEAKA